MASGSFSGTASSNSYISWRCEWSSKSNGSVSNTSNVTAKLYIWRNNTGYTTTGSGAFYITIAGNTKGMNYSQSFTNGDSGVVRLDHTVTVGHNGDGSKSITISCQSTGKVVLSGSTTAKLDTIPRASSIDSFSTSSNYVESTFTVKYTPKYAVNQRLRISVPGVYAIKTINLGTQSTGQKTTTATLTTSELETLYKKYPNTDRVSIGVVIETWSGSSKIGESSELKKTLYFSNTLVPTFDSATLAPVNQNNYENWGIYIQNYSKVKTTFNNAKGVYNSTIKSYIVNGVEYSANNSVSEVLTSFGNSTIKVKVKDSRGRMSSEQSYTISVEAYEPPQLSIGGLYRCDSKFNINDDEGIYLKAILNTSYSEIGNNSLSIKLYYKEQSSSEWNNYGNIGTGEQKILNKTFEINKTYDVKITATDLVYGEVSAAGVIETSNAIIDILKGGKGIAFGKMASKEDTAEFNEDWNVEVHGQEIDNRYSIPVAYTKRTTLENTGSSIQYWNLFDTSTSGDIGHIFNNDYAEFYHDDGSTANCVTIKKGGWYKITYSGRWNDNNSYSSYLATGSRLIGVSINKSVTDDWGVWSHLLQRLTNNGTSILKLNDGDQVRFVTHSQGASSVKNVEIYIEKID